MEEMVLLPYDIYQRLLSEASKLTPTSNERQEKEEEKQEKEQNKEGDKLPSTLEHLNGNDSNETLLLQFPKTLQSEARRLLQYLEGHITWNERGEIIINGKVIPQSNIIDLIKVQLNDSRHVQQPIGIREFEKSANRY